MTNLTVWSNGTNVLLHQLSDDPADGTPQEQVAYLATLEAFAGLECVSLNYQGGVPNDDERSWRWDGTKIIAVYGIPDSVSPRQVRLLLLSQGLLEQVEQMIQAQDKATQIAWEFALEFKRNDPLLNNLATNLGLTNEQVDQFFIAAARL